MAKHPTVAHGIEEVQEDIWSLWNSKIRPADVVEVKYHTGLVGLVR